MGVHGLWRLIEPAGKPVPLESLENKVLAVGILFSTIIIEQLANESSSLVAYVKVHDRMNLEKLFESVCIMRNSVNVPGRGPTFGNR